MKVKWLGETEFLYFTHGKIYDVLSVEEGWYRIVDDSGDDYLYPPDADFEIIIEESETQLPEEKKTYILIGADGKPYQSDVKGTYGGHRGTKVYGCMDCSAARRALNSDTRDVYIRNRVFFLDEATALAAGYRPCGTCLREKYNQYKADKEKYRAQFGFK